MEQVDAERFPKLMAYLKNPLSRRVRTNNHVERTNRMFRFLEKVRSKWRRRKTLVRFVVLTLDGIWKERTTAEAKRADPSKPKGPGKTEGASGDRCITMKIAACRFAGDGRTIVRSGSMPPADAPITMMSAGCEEATAIVLF